MSQFDNQNGPVSKEEADKFAAGLNGPDRFQQLLGLLGMDQPRSDQPKPIAQQIQPQQDLNLDAAKEAAFRRALMGNK